MNASKTFSLDFLKLLFHNLAIANIGDASGLQPSGAAGSYYLRLCVGDPDFDPETDPAECDAKTLGTECAYTGYVAGGIAIPRTTDDWDVSYDDDNLKALLTTLNASTFGKCTADTENARYIELWKNNTGNTLADRIAWIKLTSDLAISSGITPSFAAGAFTFSFF